MLGQELNVVGPIAAAAFDIVHVGIRDEDADVSTEVDDFVQPLFADEIDDRDRPGNNLARGVFYELDVQKNLAAEMFLQLPELVSHRGRIESALDIGIAVVRLHGPEGRVIPGVIGKQGPGAQAQIGARISDFPACFPGSGSEGCELL